MMSKRIALPGAFVERRASVQDVLIEIRMALGRRHEPDRTVTVFVVVPAHQLAHPGARGKQGIERLERVSGPILQGLEQRLGIRVVVAYARATQRRHDTQRLKGGEHRRPFHRATVIRMQNHLVGLYRFACAKVPEDFAGQRAAFLRIDLPADGKRAANPS